MKDYKQFLVDTQNSDKLAEQIKKDSDAAKLIFEKRGENGCV